MFAFNAIRLKLTFSKISYCTFKCNIQVVKCGATPQKQNDFDKLIIHSIKKYILFTLKKITENICKKNSFYFSG